MSVCLPICLSRKAQDHVYIKMVPPNWSEQSAPHLPLALQRAGTCKDSHAAYGFRHATVLLMKQTTAVAPTT